MTPKQNEIQFTVNLEIDVLTRLKIMADYADISRHKLIVNLLKIGIEQIEVLEHVGIFQLGILVRNMAESTNQAKVRKSGEQKIAEMPVPLRIEKILVERLERLAVRGELNRQRMAQNIIKAGLEELEAGKKYGLTQLAVKIRDMHDLFAGVLEIGKQAFYAGKEVKPK